MKLFLDTNILIDYFARRGPFVAPLVQLRIMQLFGDVELWASARSFTDIFYVLHKQVGAVELQRAFEESASFLKICSIDGTDVLEASKLQWPDFEDCLIDRAAQKVKADFILTRDPKGFERSKIPRKDAQSFVEWLDREWGISYDAEPVLKGLAAL